MAGGRFEAHMMQPPLPLKQHLFHLSPEIIVNILEQLCPTTCLTSYQSNASRPEVHEDYFQCRKGLASLCLASKWTRSYATSYLYRIVVLASSKELLYFFRTMADKVYLRQIVRAFAWVGILSTDDPNVDMVRRNEEELACLGPPCWASINWPSCSTDVSISQRMSIEGPGDLVSWKLLGAVLGMIPNVVSVFMLQDNKPTPPGRVIPSLEQNAVSALLSPLGHSEFLQNLKTLTLEPYPEPKTAYVTAKSLMYHLINSPSIYRIETKGYVKFETIRDFASRFWYEIGASENITSESVTSENVKELLIIGATNPHNDIPMIVKVFPQLKSFEAEYERTIPIADTTFLDASQALAKLSKSLQNLSLTTKPGQSWKDANVPPLLPMLSQMSVLKSLKVDTIWIFGTTNPFGALTQIKQLPASLIYFHLIDYWGTSESDQFYPQLESAWKLSEFYSQAFTTLNDVHELRLRNLKTVTLASSVLSSHGWIGGDEKTYMINNCSYNTLDGTKLSAKIRNLYNGVSFSIITPGRSHAETCSSWANMYVG